ncbi:MAG: TraB/GumN family protein [Gammaproteobacteria bacterium]
MNRLAIGLAAMVLWPFVVSAQEPLVEEAPEQILVTGKLPGPAMWKVSNGDNALWIFATLSPIPKDMIWESDRVEGVIAKADEYLEPPGADIKVSPLVYLNPINYIRGYRLAKRLQRNPDDKPLQAVMPPELYQRFEALKAQYFPGEKDVEQFRPIAAGQLLVQQVQLKNGLAQNSSILKKINRLVAKKRGLKTTTTQVEVKLEGGYGTLAERVETMINSLPAESEMACVESQIQRMETELEAMRSRANSWAQGWVDDFRTVIFRGDEADACTSVMLASSESQLITEVIKQSQQKWLAAADKALASNKTTFAVLTIGEMFRDNGLLAQLQDKGYLVRQP